mmetsp:Transcript_34058/g.45537  ORF Transcript_34058/g.45537 Transcript_34058/m.45537 type:complete len:227 (+) Transcript_34058:132-812(+)
MALLTSSCQPGGGNLLQRSGPRDDAGLVGEPAALCGEARHRHSVLLLCAGGGRRAQSVRLVQRLHHSLGRADRQAASRRRPPLRPRQVRSHRLSLPRSDPPRHRCLCRLCLQPQALRSTQRTQNQPPSVPPIPPRTAHGRHIHRFQGVALPDHTRRGRTPQFTSGHCQCLAPSLRCLLFRPRPSLYSACYCFSAVSLGRCSCWIASSRNDLHDGHRNIGRKCQAAY